MANEFPDFPYEFRHPVCNKPGFFYAFKPKTEDEIKSEDGIHLDGKPLEFGTIIMCDSCGLPVERQFLKPENVWLRTEFDKEAMETGDAWGP